MNINDITKAWDEAARTEAARSAIHPSGSMGDDEYERSGMFGANYLLDQIDPYLGSLPSSPKVLDFGCGDGRVLKHLVGIFRDLWGADASEAMLQRLVENVPGVKTVQSNAIDGALGGRSFDLIYSMAVFIHHDHSGGRKMMAALAEAVSRNGILALQIPCYAAPRERGAWTDVTVWTEQMLRDTARSAGLQVLEVFSSPGEFSFDNIGENHMRLQLFRRSSL